MRQDVSPRCETGGLRFKELQHTTPPPETQGIPDRRVPVTHKIRTMKATNKSFSTPVTPTWKAFQNPACPEGGRRSSRRMNR